MTVLADRTIMMRGSKRGALSIALVGIGAAAMYNWVLSPQVGYLRAVQRYQPVVNEVAEETGRIGRTLDQKLRQLRTVQGELAKTQDNLFTQAEAKVFLGDLQSFVEQTGCKVTTAEFTSDSQAGQPRESKQRTATTSSHVDLMVVGQYDQITTLLERLQTNRRRIWVDSCSLKLSDLRLGRLECKLTLTLYALSDKEGSSHE